MEETKNSITKDAFEATFVKDSESDQEADTAKPMVDAPKTVDVKKERKL